MKKLLVGIFLLLGSYGAASSQTYAQTPAVAHGTHDPLSEKKHMIAQAHDALLKLPYSKEYIREVIVAEVKNNRHTVAPHYPERQPGSNVAHIDHWITTYPNEVNAYLRYVGGIHRKYVLLKR